MPFIHSLCCENVIDKHHFQIFIYFPYCFRLFVAKILDPNRPSRKFSQPKPLEDQVDADFREKKAARADRLNALAEETVDEIALEKKKAQRLEAARQLEEKYLLLMGSI